MEEEVQILPSLNVIRPTITSATDHAGGADKKDNNNTQSLIVSQGGPGDRWVVSVSVPVSVSLPTVPSKHCPLGLCVRATRIGTNSKMLGGGGGGGGCEGGGG